MTTPDIDDRIDTPTVSPPIAIPEITGEEDLPFPAKKGGTSPDKRVPVDNKLHQTDDLDKEITRFRFSTGRVVLFIAMGAMIVMVLLDLFASQHLGAERDMIENAFEAFKLITVTILGYIFGSSGSNGSNPTK